jgi:hypothetical protein
VPSPPRNNPAVATIYVYLPAEGVDVWRPVEASREDDLIYRIADTPEPLGELWEFPPGSTVRCEWRDLSEARTLVAVALA